MYKYFDTHAHLDMSQFDEDRDILIKKLQDENIGVITIGVDKKSSLEAIKLSEKYDNVFASVGFHPIDAKEEFKWEYFSEIIQNPKIVAIGECGLEFFRIEKDSEEEKKRQIKLFESQIDFAVKYDKPLMIHCRNAHKDVLAILKVKKQKYGDKLRGIIHFFSGNIQEAQEYIDLGFSFSFGGVITFTSDYDEVVKFIPIDRILSETDAPFVAPEPYRGKRNEPIYIKEVVKKIAELKEEDLAKTKDILVQNAVNMFALGVKL
ncbi:MAG: TatD family hydrolase [Candidatus Pacebacteria bacterium]|nr:TatD family hydrolase [Candidatus Paceibacterota bacterium]